MHIFAWFVPNFANIAARLTRHLEMARQFHFERLEETEIYADDSILHLLSSQSISSDEVVDTDVCDKLSGAFFARAARKAGKNRGILVKFVKQRWKVYRTMQRECFAVVKSVLLLRVYLEEM